MQLIEEHVAIARPDGVPAWDVDPFSEESLGDPEAYYAELRARGPFVYLERYAMLACGRYREVKEVFSDWERFVSSRGVGLSDFSQQKPWRPPSIILEVDPPFHTKTRAVMARALSPGAVAALKASLRLAADALIDALLAKENFDAVPDLAETFPIGVFPQAVGLTVSDRRRLLDYGAMVFNALGPDNARRRHWMAKGPDVVPWITEQCRRDRLRPDGFGASIYAAADAGEISHDEAAMLVRSLLSAGLDTTVATLANAVWCLARHPAEFARLKADPRLARQAFDEVLRFKSPIHSFSRTAPRATEVSGIAIPADAKILCVLGSANLDPEHWTDADRFDITRRATGHLALGVGIHACVGQNLARAETEAVLAAIASKVGTIAFDGEPVWRAGNSIHTLDALPVTFRAK